MFETTNQTKYEEHIHGKQVWKTYTSNARRTILHQKRCEESKQQLPHPTSTMPHPPPMSEGAV